MPFARKWFWKRIFKKNVTLLQREKIKLPQICIFGLNYKVKSKGWPLSRLPEAGRSKLLPVIGWHETPRALQEWDEKHFVPVEEYIWKPFTGLLSDQLVIKASSSLPDDLNLFSY